MVDIHSHIIPCIDAGSQDMAKSVAMAIAAWESGVTDMIATPHCNQKGVYENYSSPELYRHLETLRRELDMGGVRLNVHLGAEVFATEDMVKLYRENKLLTLNGSRYMLVEFDFSDDLLFMENTLYSLLDEGLIPILAHPERYTALQDRPDAAMIWYEEGVGIQLNKGSLFGRFGRDALQLADILTDTGAVSCIASDAHGTQLRTPDMAEISELLSAKYPPGTAELLLEENPRRILFDLDLPKPEADGWA